MPLCPDCPEPKRFGAMADVGYKILANPIHPISDGMELVAEGFRNVSQLEALTEKFDSATQCTGVEEGQCPNQRAIQAIMDRYWRENPSSL